MTAAKSKIIMIILLIVAVLSIAALVVVFLLGRASTTVPSFTGMTYLEAAKAGQEVELTVKDGQMVDGDKDNEGKILEQYPAAGTEAKAGDVVMVKISRGPGDGRTPNVIKMSTDEAKRAIEKAGFEVGSINQVPGVEKAGTVLAQNPKGNKELEKGKRISIEVSDGTMVYVPNVIGLTEWEKVVDRIEDAGLKYEYVDGIFSNKVKAGAVIKQSPGPGAMVKRGTTVKVWDSLGPEDEYWDDF